MTDWKTYQTQYRLCPKSLEQTSKTFKFRVTNTIHLSKIWWVKLNFNNKTFSMPNTVPWTSIACHILKIHACTNLSF